MPTRRPVLDRTVKLGPRNGAEFVGTAFTMAAEYLPQPQSEEARALGIPLAANAGRFTIRHIPNVQPGWLLQLDTGAKTKIEAVRPLGRREYLELEAAGAV